MTVSANSSSGKVRRVADVRREIQRDGVSSAESDRVCASTVKWNAPLSAVCSTIDECNSVFSSSRDTPASLTNGGSESHSATRQTIKCATDLKLLCRLVGLHSRPEFSKGSDIQLNIDRTQVSFKLVDIVDIGCNVRCIILEEPMWQWAHRALRNLTSLDPSGANIDHETVGGLHTILAFNWFSPKSFRDYFSLGLQMCNNELDRNHLLGKIYLNKAEDFLWSAELIKYFDFTSARNERRLITATGFSLGGAIAHAFIYLLRELKQLYTPMRIVGFGCPRIGSSRFTDWFCSNATADSINIILYDECFDQHELLIDYDPVCQSPPLVNDFAFHPNCFLLHKRFGTIRPLTDDEKDFLSQQPTEKTRSNAFVQIVQSLPGMGHKDKERRWKKLHGITKYYEAMYGLGDE
eukprot:Gregarina_sp_Poly_1__5683@NODE_29_length_19459_cov_103_994070_g26_i0_p5_GENE_NODE_29_length_19459_cov_103_994070_g26_i0NODE_29_length_19459_cov_103_994070_g26_i0_p5_ORF_typecomplete_len408_score45_11Lipase_3/PF01764_25/3_1e08DUF676/PF05057_14/0_0084DUF2974/PF11187_8/0_16_NODE_29_length_19459_cov_103_994070_g26_i01784019063